MRFSGSTYLIMFLSLETFTSIIRTGLAILVKLINLVNSVIIFLPQMILLRLLTFLLGFKNVILIVLLIWISFFLLTLALVLPPLENSEHVIVSVSIDFLSNLQRDDPFHCIACDYSRADCDGFRDHLRGAPWVNIFKLGSSAAASEFSDWLQVVIGEYITHRKYQVKLYSSPWFSAACAVP